MNMRALLVGCAGLLLTVVMAAPAAADPRLDVVLEPVTVGRSVAVVAPPDRVVVATGEPSRPCAAPAFARPIAAVDGALLAETGVRHGLQVVALVALALAALTAPRVRSGRVGDGLAPPRRAGSQD